MSVLVGGWVGDFTGEHVLLEFLAPFLELLH